MDLVAADRLFGRSGDWTFHCLGPAALKQQQQQKKNHSKSQETSGLTPPPDPVPRPTLTAAAAR